VKIKLSQTAYVTLMMAVSLFITFMRRTDAFYFPQFYAEDGIVWYPDAYHLGALKSFLLPQDGYYQTLARIGAAISLLVPLKSAPSIFNALALCIHLLPVCLILSGRLKGVFSSRVRQVLIILVYLCLPNTIDLHMNLTTAQWRLALFVALLLVSSKPTSTFFRITDVLFVVLSAFSGPYGVFLGPVAFFFAYRVKNVYRMLLSAILSVGASFQLLSLLFLNPAVRPEVELGVSLLSFFRIFSGQVVLGLLLGENGFHLVYQSQYWESVFPVVISLIGLYLIITTFIQSSDELRTLIVFSALIFCSALISPTIGTDVKAWQTLEMPNAATRYWIIPIFVFFLCLLEQARQLPRRLAPQLASVLILILPIGVSFDIHYEKWERQKFVRATRRLNKASKGSSVNIPIYPPGYTMVLKKR
jgi:hypothetical protein